MHRCVWRAVGPQAAEGTDNIQDELDVVIEISRVRTLVGEWIPFGSNNIVALNERLGALERCQVRADSETPPV